jgi:hypothetical protein
VQALGVCVRKLFTGNEGAEWTCVSQVAGGTRSMLQVQVRMSTIFFFFLVVALLLLFSVRRLRPVLATTRSNSILFCFSPISARQAVLTVF